MDVQGHEKHVLEGAANLLASGVPVISEFWPYGLERAGVSPDEFSRFAQNHFGSFFDLSEEEPRQQSVQQIPNLFSQYRGVSFTDLLLVKG
jgi:hypothetical protein